MKSEQTSLERVSGMYSDSDFVCVCVFVDLADFWFAAGAAEGSPAVCPQLLPLADSVPTGRRHLPADPGRSKREGQCVFACLCVCLCTKDMVLSA